MRRWQRVSGALLDPRSLRYGDQLLARCSRTNLSQRGVSGHRSIHGLVSGIIYRDEKSSAADLLNGIEPLQGQSHAASSKKSLLLLLSAHHARLALNDALPEAVINRVFGGETADIGQLESITAVVDALPSFTAQDEGRQGLAYLVQDAESSSPFERSTPLRDAAQRAGSLTFALDLDHQQAQSKWTLQLPLTQTIFSTGLTSTLIYRTGRDAGQKLENAQVSVRTRLSSLNAELPLLPLTACRKVGNAMGNIIRTVTSFEGQLFDRTEGEEAASLGLEKAVTAYFTTLSIPPEPVNVWALIIPRTLLGSGRLDEVMSSLTLDAAQLQQFWTGEQSLSQYAQLLVELIPERGRLVKVLSGGGGWGKKAGLLSIDPDLEYSTRELRDDHGWNFNFDEPGESSLSASVVSQIDQALGNCVDEGDGIMFFIAPKMHTPVSGIPTVGENGFAMTLGACHPSDYEAGAATETQHIVNRFGMYSETGLAANVVNIGTTSGKSKLEVPGLRLTVA